MNLPEPFVGPQVNLQDFPFMPIDITRLFGSEFHASNDDSTWRAGLTLWLKSWHQVPAASLPDDDTQLARLAELGREKAKWRRIRDGALHGWVKCSDGRLYHRVVAEKALEAWVEKLAQAKSSEAGNAKRYGHEFNPASFDVDLQTAFEQLARLNPSSRILARKKAKYLSKTPKPLEDKDASPPSGSDTAPTGTPNDPEKAPKRQGQGQGQGNTLSAADGGSGVSDDAYRLFAEAHPAGYDEPDSVRRELAKRLEKVPIAEIVDGAKRYAALCRSEGRTGRHIGSPAKWLVDGKWKNGLRRAGEKPVDMGERVDRDTPEGRAWTEHERSQGRTIKWILPHGRNGPGTYFGSRWPPDCDAAEVAA